jgi:hypothetical protein
MFSNSIEAERLSAVKSLAQAHFRGVTAARVSITGEIIVAHRPIAGHSRAAL